jgi:AcrR family transcriptional regulator
MSRGVSPEQTTRPYDARRRRERAEQERQATRRRVVEAARGLFPTKGYVATTMADVAREAGVALQSLYTAGKSKADLLRLVTDLAVGGSRSRSQAAANLVVAHRRRHETFAGLIAMLPERSLRLSRAESTHTAWAIASIDVFLLLRSIRNWDASHYADCLSQTLVNQLLVSSTDP